MLAQESHAAPELGEPVLSVPGWSVVDREEPWAPSYENPSAQLQRSYLADDSTASSIVGLHVAYFRQQGADRKLVSSNNQIAHPGDEQWSVATTADRRVAFESGATLNVKVTQLRRPIGSADATRLLIWHVYWVNDRYITSDILAKAHGALSRLLGRGDDGAAVFLYTVDTQPGTADALLGRFVLDNFGAIEAQLRRTRDGG